MLVSSKHNGIYARLSGTARIYAVSDIDSSKKDYITVNVTSGTICVDSITLNITGLYLEKGDRFNLTATVCPTNATNKSISWRSTNSSAASVSGGNVTAKSEGSAYIYAEAQDGSGEYAVCYVNVTENVLVSSVTIDPPCLTLNVGGSECLREIVCPTNADNKCVRWSSDRPNVATVNPDTGLVMAHSAGTAVITATACDGSGKKGTCTVRVNAPVPVTGIEVCPASKTMNVGDTDYLCATVYPYNATDKSVIWCSSNENVAEVSMRSGHITAKQAGIATITATTVDGEYCDCCEITVDGREKVTISKDGNYSKIIFNDGKTWKCNIFYYNTTLELNLPIDTERSNYNASIDFTEKQLGFLFRLDPNGVIYYVKNKNLGEGTSTTDYLIYRDNIFKEIYGRSPHYFTYENSQLYYYTGVNNDNRYYVYSEAELIFGMLPRWTISNIMKTFFDVALSIISIYVPSLGAALLTIDIVTAFYFTGAVDGAVNSAANEFITQVIESNYSDKLAKRFGWASTIVNLIPSLLETALPPDIDEEQISIYENAYQNDSYVIKISDSNQTVDLNEFIEHYKSLLP